jgi:hypothetical protein
MTGLTRYAPYNHPAKVARIRKGRIQNIERRRQNRKGYNWLKYKGLGEKLPLERKEGWDWHRVCS